MDELKKKIEKISLYTSTTLAEVIIIGILIIAFLAGIEYKIIQIESTIEDNKIVVSSSEDVVRCPNCNEVMNLEYEAWSNYETAQYQCPFCDYRTPEHKVDEPDHERQAIEELRGTMKK